MTISAGIAISQCAALPMKVLAEGTRSECVAAPARRRWAFCGKKSPAEVGPAIRGMGSGGRPIHRLPIMLLPLTAERIISSGYQPKEKARGSGANPPSRLARIEPRRMPHSPKGQLRADCERFGVTVDSALPSLT
jgi:hypothetical protein